MTGGLRYICLVSLLLLCALRARADDPAWYGDRSVEKGTRDDQIYFWEEEINKLRHGELARAYEKLHATQLSLSEARQQSGWLFTSESVKARIKLLDAEYQRNMDALVVLRRQEEMMLAKLKPLYGIVSRRFAQEQRSAIVDAVHQVQRISYDQAWYSSLFSIRDAESFTDIIVGFLLEWLLGYALMYPFAALYYAFWTAPRSIYAYSSGPSDVFVGICAWLVSVFVMLLPVLALVGSFWYIRRYYGDRVKEALRAAGERQRRR